MDTRTKGWEEAGRNRDGAMEGFGLRLSGSHPWREPLYRLEQPEKQRGTSGGCGLTGRPLQGC